MQKLLHPPHQPEHYQREDVHAEDDAERDKLVLHLLHVVDDKRHRKERQIAQQPDQIRAGAAPLGILPGE